jgi:hypothetical protein
MPKISALPPMTTAAADDEQPIVDKSVTTTKKWTLTLLVTYLQGLAGWISSNAMLGSAIVKKANIDYTDVDVYSTSEVDTGKKWTDGRAIYRKVLIGNVTLGVGTNNIAHGIASIVNLELVNFTYSIRLSSTTRGNNIATAWHRESGGNWSNPVGMTSTNLAVYSSFAWGASAYTVVLEYCK